MIELITLKNKIEQLNKKQQIEVLKIVFKMDVAYSENNNGTFFNLSGLDDTQLSQINSYINYVSDQENTLAELETVKNELCETFFNGNKNGIKDTNSTNGNSYESSNPSELQH
tara:strand:- start:1660 stop:1998 length:339 start_codon:yes stop_codon:yes gene_type:complete